MIPDDFSLRAPGWGFAGSPLVHENLLLLNVLLSQLIDMDQEPADRSEVLRVILLWISVDNRLEKLQIVEDLWEDVDQATSLHQLVAKTQND